MRCPAVSYRIWAIGKALYVSNVFPKNSRQIAGALVLGVMLFGVLLAGGITYYATPKYTHVGYMPHQPIPFSHRTHVGQLGLDCTYCHTNVFESPHANIPSTHTCMNCHDPQRGNIKGDSGLLAPLREAWATGQPLPWVRVHKVPDFVYFNHQIHVNRGISCVSCHGRVDDMVEVRQVEPYSMSWCLDCHRKPEPHVRPNAKITDLAWDPMRDWSVSPLTQFTESQSIFAQKMVRESGLHPPTNCTACHR
jgi:hypothetical protein